MRSLPPKNSGLAARLAVLLIGLVLALGMTCTNPDPVPPLAQPDEYPAARQVHQQIGGVADIPIRGFYDDQAFPNAQIQARWGGGGWTVIDPAPSGGVFEGVLSNRAIGWNDLTVRIKSGPILYETPDVGVGDVYLIAGQSNAVMVTETLRSSSLPSSTLMLDPDPASLFKWTADPLHESVQPWGSVWPLLADAVSQSTGVPVMFVATAESGAGLVDYPDWAVGGFFWNRMLQNLSVATSGEMCPRAVLWFQGETDAGFSVSTADYKDALVGFSASLQAALSCPAPLVAGVIGPFTLIPETDVEAIRQAQRDAAAESADILPGPETSDLPIWDFVHFGDAAVPDLLERWCLAIRPFYTGLQCPSATGPNCGQHTAKAPCNADPACSWNKRARFCEEL